MCCEAFTAMEFYQDSLLVHRLGPFHVLLQVLCFPYLVIFINFFFLAKTKKTICILV